MIDGAAVEGKGLSVKELARITGGRLEGDDEIEIHAATADSRDAGPGCLFVALPGERTHGARFAAQALKLGACAVLVDEKEILPSPGSGQALLRVSNAELALQKAAKEVRVRACHLRVAGITGSNGKTSTKEMLACIMHCWKGRNVLVTPGNYNSRIGLPLTLMRLKENHEIAVLEMGMNHKGEMDVLADIVRPDLALITNIGTAHVGILGSREMVAREKRNILKYANEDTVVFVARRGEYHDFILEGFPGRKVFFDVWDGRKWHYWKSRGMAGSVIRRYGRDVMLNMPGEHNVLNAMAAAEMAEELGAPEECIVRGLESVRSSPGRCEVIPGRVDLILDYYNANPESLLAALKFVGSLEKKGRHVVVLGDMLELDGKADESMTQAGKAAAETGVDAIFFMGSTLERFVEAAMYGGMSEDKSRFIRGYDDMNALQEDVISFLKDGDCLLLKASRGMAFERLLPGLVEFGYVKLPRDVLKRIGNSCATGLKSPLSNLETSQIQEGLQSESRILNEESQVNA